MVAELLEQVGPGVQDRRPGVGRGARIGSVRIPSGGGLGGKLAVVGKLAVPCSLDFADQLVVGSVALGLMADPARSGQRETPLID